MGRGSITIQIQRDEHLRRKTAMGEEVYKNLAGRTTIGLSTAITSKSQMTPCQMESILEEGRSMITKEQLAFYLFPKQESQTTCAPNTTVEAKQTNEHDD